MLLFRFFSSVNVNLGMSHVAYHFFLISNILCASLQLSLVNRFFRIL